MTELSGNYCPGSFSPKGAYVWLTVMNFFCLSLILGALFTYLAVYHNEWKLGNIQAHGLFWCVKGPIMIIFYFGTILLTALTTFHVIKDVPPANGGTFWPAAAIKNGYEAIIVCFVMAIDAVMMMKYYGMDEEDYFDHKDEHLNFFMAFVDAFLAFIPQFILSLMTCGQSTVRLAKKRQELKLRRKMAGDESSTALNKDFHSKDEERDYSYYGDPMADVDLEELPRVHHDSKVFEEEGKSGTRLRELGAIDNPFKSPPQQHAYPASPYPHTGSPPKPAQTQGRYSAVPSSSSPFDDNAAVHALPPPPSAPQQQQIQRDQPAFEFEEAYTPHAQQDVLSMPPRSQFPRDRSPVPTSNASVFNPYQRPAQHANEQKVFNPYADNDPRADANPFKD
jgi:Organic solute transporter Ostalpha